MPVNQASEKLNIAQGFVHYAQSLTDAWAGVQKYNQLYIKSGISFVAGDFDNSTLQYVDPTTMGTLITQLNAFVTWMNTGGNGDIMFRDSPGTPTNI